MFNIGPAEMAVLAIIAVVVFGPDRLPALAKQAAQMLRTVRELSTNARKQLSELSPGLDESLRDLDLGTLGKGPKFNAKTALQKMIFEDDEPAPAKAQPEPPAVTLDKAERPGPAAQAAEGSVPTVPAANAADDIT